MARDLQNVGRPTITHKFSGIDFLNKTKKTPEQIAKIRAANQARDDAAKANVARRNGNR